jgi:hypothetical protein
MPATTTLRRALPATLAAGALTAAMLVGGALAATAATRTGASQPVQLSAKPVGQPGQYFDLELRPGQARRLSVALGNNGHSTVRAATYPADVYSIINGGFGAALRASPATATTRWLNYPTQQLTLPPGRAAIRTFTVTVPPGTAPGEYITSIVLENAVPLPGTGTVALNQTIRQAVAVAVRVPGPLHPSLSIGAAGHKVAAARSVIAVEVTNTGNQLLKPVATLAVHDDTGALVARARVPMDSVYAHTHTKVEITLAEALAPGDYTADLTLDDAATHTRSTAQRLPFTVTAADSQADRSRITRQVIDVLHRTGGRLPLTAVATGLVLLALTAALTLLLRRRRRARHQPRRRRASATSVAPSPPPTPRPTRTAPQPAPHRSGRHTHGRRRAPRRHGRLRIGI